jgi:hypothetical protein
MYLIKKKMPTSTKDTAPQNDLIGLEMSPVSSSTRTALPYTYDSISNTMASAKSEVLTKDSLNTSSSVKSDFSITNTPARGDIPAPSKSAFDSISLAPLKDDFAFPVKPASESLANTTLISDVSSLKPALNFANPSLKTDTFPTKGAFDSLTNAQPTFPAKVAAPMFAHTDLEIKIIAESQMDLNSRNSELNELMEQLKKLDPSFSELQQKRQNIENEYKQASEKRNQLTIELSQKKAMFDSTAASIRDLQVMLQRELQTVESLKNEKLQYERALEAAILEKESLLNQHKDCTAEIVLMKTTLKDLSDEANSFRPQVEQIKQELKKLQQVYEVNKKLLESSQEAHKVAQSDLKQEEERLEIEVKKAQQLRTQIDVQEEINRKERQKIAKLEGQKQIHVSKSQELLTKSQELKSVANTSDTFAPADFNPFAGGLGVAKKKESTGNLVKSDKIAPEKKNTEISSLRSDSFEYLNSDISIGSDFKAKSESSSPAKNTNARSMISEPGYQSKKSTNEVARESFDFLASAIPSNQSPQKINSDMLDLLSFDRPIQEQQPKQKPPSVIDFASFNPDAELARAFDAAKLKPTNEIPIIATNKDVKNIVLEVGPDSFTFDATFDHHQPAKSNQGIKSFDMHLNSQVDFPGFDFPTLSQPIKDTKDPFSPANGQFDDPFSAKPTHDKSQAAVKKAQTPTEDLAPEVKEIMSMGFSKEQSMNALELYF